MKAVVFDEELKLVNDYQKPTPKQGEALIKISMVGICNTDYEITKGYMGYKGILGHEFVGVVEDVNSEDKTLVGKRVVGEINCGCGECDLCKQHLERHCFNRQTLGIFNKDGCFAEYLCMPVKNLLVVPDNVKNEEAVFVEPLAAALEITEQLHIKPFEKVLVLGDGKLGLLIALALKNSNLNVLLVGKHQNKLDIASKQGIETILLNDLKIEKTYDVVVEATGSINGFETALSLTRPRGTLVLKSTVATGKEFNFAPIVIDEITVLGSRCGQFAPALRMLADKKIDFSDLISDIYPIDKAIEAFERNKDKDSIKVLIKLC